MISYNSGNEQDLKSFASTLVFEIVDENYGGVIENLNITNMKIPNISGYFHSPRPGNRSLKINFSIDDKSVLLVPQNLEIIDDEIERRYHFARNLSLKISEDSNYFPVEFFSFSQKQMNCTIGWSCKGDNGYACLSKAKKNCNNELSANHKNYINWLDKSKSASSDLFANLDSYGDSSATNKPMIPKPMPSGGAATKPMIPKPMSSGGAATKKQMTPKPMPTKGISHTELIESGRLFAEKYIKNAAPSKEEKDKYDTVFLKANDIKSRQENGENLGRKEIEDYIRDKEDYYAINNQRIASSAKDLNRLKNDIKAHHIKNNPNITEDGERWIKNIKIGKGLNGDALKNSLEALRDFYQISGGKGTKSLKNIDYVTPRAFAHAEKKMINVGEGAKKIDVFHESAHHIEYQSLKLRNAAFDFIVSRAFSKVPKKMRDITGNQNYRDDEIALEDKFIVPYVGKIYGGKGAPTEVISMGVERFSTPEMMAKFYNKDPEHFYFTLGVLLQKNEN